MATGILELVLDQAHYRTLSSGDNIHHPIVEAMNQGKISFGSGVAPGDLAILTGAGRDYMILAPNAIPEDNQNKWVIDRSATNRVGLEVIRDITPPWWSYQHAASTPAGGSAKTSFTYGYDDPFFLFVHCQAPLDNRTIGSTGTALIIQWGGGTINSLADTPSGTQSPYRLVLYSSNVLADEVWQWNPTTSAWVQIGAGKLAPERTAFSVDDTPFYLFFLPVPPNGFLIQSSTGNYIFVPCILYSQGVEAYHLLTITKCEYLRDHGVTPHIFSGGRIFIGNNSGWTAGQKAWTSIKNDQAMQFAYCGPNFPTSGKTITYTGILSARVDTTLHYGYNQECVITVNGETNKSMPFMEPPGTSISMDVQRYDGATPVAEGNAFDRVGYTITLTSDGGTRTPYLHHAALSIDGTNEAVEAGAVAIDPTSKLLGASARWHRDRPKGTMNLQLNNSEDYFGDYDDKIDLPLQLKMGLGETDDILLFDGTSGTDIVEDNVGVGGDDEGNYAPTLILSLTAEDNWRKLEDLKLGAGLHFDGKRHTLVAQHLATVAGANVAYMDIDEDNGDDAFLQSDPNPNSFAWSVSDGESAAEFLMGKFRYFSNWDIGFRGPVFYYKARAQTWNEDAPGYEAPTVEAGFYQNEADASGAAGYYRGKLPILNPDAAYRKQISGAEHRNVIYVAGLDKNTGQPFYVVAKDTKSITDPTYRWYRGKEVIGWLPCSGITTVEAANIMAADFLRRYKTFEEYRSILSYYNPYLWIARSDPPVDSGVLAAYNLVRCEETPGDGNWYLYRIVSMEVDFTKPIITPADGIRWFCRYGIEKIYKPNGEPVAAEEPEEEEEPEEVP